MAEWYYAQHEEQFGPVTAAALKEMAQAGTLDRDDLIWREGMQRWAPAHKVRGLFADDSDARAKSERRPEVNGEAEPASDAGGHMSDVVPVEDEEEGESGSVSGDGETAIDVLPLAGPEESKLHMPVLTTPDDPSTARSESNEIVVFEPASPPAPPKLRPKAEAAPAQQDSAVARQTRVDVPKAASASWLVGLGLFSQVFTLVTCALVILVGGVVYLGALMMLPDPG